MHISDIFLALLLLSMAIATVFFIFKKRRFAIVAVVFAVVFFVSLGITSDKKQAEMANSATPSPSPSVGSQTPAPSEMVKIQTEGQQNEIQSNRSAPQIKVTSAIVKKIEDKCRYFFDLRNTGDQPFEGRVVIMLMTDTGLKVGIKAVETESPLKPGQGIARYIDANTCPGWMIGGGGVTKFTYAVHQNNKLVHSGEGTISKEYEAL